MRAAIGLVMTAWLSGCVGLLDLAPQQTESIQAASAGRSPVSFAAVVARIEPLAEQMCRQRAPQSNCDFRIFVDDRAGQPPNAYQTVDAQGRPELGFTAALIASVGNNDELAFIMGHEAAHHIAGHLAQTRETALAGALLGGLLATIAGADPTSIEAAQGLGGTVGARTYSKEFELEADRLGTIISYRAGFDPLVGVLFFNRIPDPGDRFLGTHPPNRARIDAVRQTMAGLG